MNIILSMFFSGNIAFLLFILIEKIYKYLFSQKFKYTILKFSLFLYITPLGYIKTYLERKYYIFNKNHNIINFFIDGNKPYIIISSGKSFYNTAFKIELGTFIIWICFASLIFIYYLFTFTKTKKYIFCMAHLVTSPYILDIRDKYLNKLHIKQNIYIYQINQNISPFTIGFFRPIIVIPEIENSSELDLILYHELCHIKRKDGYILFFRLLITGIYWFNPLNFLLNSYLSKTCELACDELVIKDSNLTTRKKYANLIIKLSTYDNISTQKTTLSFNNNYKIISERIQFIMKLTNSKSYLAVFFFTVLISCSMMPILAYEPVQKFETEAEIYIPSTDEFIAYNSEKNSFIVEDKIKIFYEKQFTDLDGNIYNVDIPTSINNCEHTFLDGVFSTHQKNTTGGCTIINYASQICTKCNYLKINNFLSKTEYATCPH